MSDYWDQKSNDNLKIEPNSRYRTNVHHFSSNGNAIIQKDGQSVNVGPLSKDAIGEELEFVSFSGINDFAICINRNFWPQGYLHLMRNIISGKHIPYDITIPEPKSSGEPSEKYENNNPEADSQTGSGLDNKEDSNSSGSELDDETTGNDQNDENNGGDGTGNEQSSSEPDSEDLSDAQLATLRNKAKREATENPSPVSKTTQTKSEYTRSDAVREYVMARASGVCEGCGEPAPFENSDGDPYLHAHHVFELSDGGSDTPETVISLCPNCHYQIHHGKNGKEYNRELINRLKEIEGKKSDQ